VPSDLFLPLVAFFLLGSPLPLLESNLSLNYPFTPPAPFPMSLPTTMEKFFPFSSHAHPPSSFIVGCFLPIFCEQRQDLYENYRVFFSSLSPFSLHTRRYSWFFSNPIEPLFEILSLKFRFPAEPYYILPQIPSFSLPMVRHQLFCWISTFVVLPILCIEHRMPLSRGLLFCYFPTYGFGPNGNSCGSFL